MSETNVVQFRPRDGREQTAARGILTHDKLKGLYRHSEEAHSGPRELAFRDRDYYDNYDDDQWTAYEKKKLKDRRQQISTTNKIKRFVNGLLGQEQRARSDPKAFPRHPEQAKAADIATDLLDFIENNVRMDQAASESAKDLAIEGIEVAEVTLDPDTKEIELEKIDYDRFFYDPRSRKRDFSDARYLGYTEWMNQEDATERYQFEDGAEEVIKSTMDSIGSYDAGFEDKPYGVYSMRDQARVRIVVVYYRRPDGVWMVAHFTGAGILFEGESPWPDQRGNASGLIAQSLYVSRKGYRFGLVRDQISIQNDINQRKSKSLHLMNDRRSWGVDGWTNDENQAKEAMSRPDGHVQVNMPIGQGWGLLDSTAETQGNFELLQQAIADMELQGVFTPGTEGGLQGQSGRAIIALQNAGITAENLFFDSHNDWKLRVYRRFWFMAKKFWTEERAIRVTKDREASFIMINQPVGFDRFGRTIMRNPIAEIDVDIIIEAGPDLVTLQQEQFQTLSKILPGLAQLPLPFAIMLLEASQLRDKDKAIEALRQMSQAPTPDPLIQAGAEADVMLRRAQAGKTEAETAKTNVEAARAFADAQAGPGAGNDR